MRCSDMFLIASEICGVLTGSSVIAACAEAASSPREKIAHPQRIVRRTRARSREARKWQPALQLLKELQQQRVERLSQR